MPSGAWITPGQRHSVTPSCSASAEAPRESLGCFLVFGKSQRFPVLGVSVLTFCAQSSPMSYRTSVPPKDAGSTPAPRWGLADGLLLPSAGGRRPVQRAGRGGRSRRVNTQHRERRSGARTSSPDAPADGLRDAAHVTRLPRPSGVSRDESLGRASTALAGACPLSPGFGLCAGARGQ